MNLTLVISIINFKTPELTLSCVQSVLEDLDGIDGEVVIVDNYSDDGSTERIADWIAEQPQGTRVRLVCSSTNAGFSGGHNKGMAAVEADYYLILNSDAFLRPGFCKVILAAASANPAAGLIVPRLEGDTGEVQINCFRFPGVASEFIRGANSGPITRLLRSHEVALGLDPDPAKIEWASFACILLKGAMVREIGSMDEGYFLYFEDAEYCLRARRASWDIIRASDAVAVHFRGGSGPVKALVKARKRLPAYYYGSRTRFLYQAHGYHGLWAANIAWSLARIIALLRRLGGRPSDNARLWEGRDLWTNVLRPLGPRHAPGE